MISIIVLIKYMKKSNSESDLIPLNRTPHSRAFVRKLNSPEYQERRTAEMVADNEIDTLMDEIAETRPDKIVKEENNFIKKVYKTRPAPVDRDFHELAKRVKRGGKKTRKRRKGTRRRKLKKKKSTKKKRRGGVAPPAPSLPTVDEINPSMDGIRSALQQISNRPYSYENSENFINLAFDIFTDFDMMVNVVSASGYTTPYYDTPLDEFFQDVIINNFEIAVRNDARHVDTIRRRLGTEEIRNIINSIQRSEGSLTPRAGALRPSEKIQQYMDYIETLGDDPMDVEGGKRRKKKKSTKKKKRGGVAPVNSNAINNQWLAEQNRTRPRIVQRRSTVVHSASLIQGLHQARPLPPFYIDLAMTNLTNPETVWTIDQEGRLDEIMDLVTERLTFFVNRNPDERQTIRRYLDDTTRLVEALEEVDMNLAERYGNFIEQIRALTE